MAREIESLRAQLGLLPTHSASALPDPADYYNITTGQGRIGLITVHDDATVGPTVAWSNGSAWKRPNAVGTVS